MYYNYYSVVSNSIVLVKYSTSSFSDTGTVTSKFANWPGLIEQSVIIPELYDAN